MGASNFSVYTAFKAKDNVSQIFKNMRAGASGFGNQLNSLSATSRTFGTGMQNSFNKINTVIGATVTFFAASAVKTTIEKWIDLASDLQETIGKTGEVFKVNTLEVLKWSKTSITSMGLAEQTALDTASLYGDMGTGMGMTTKRASSMSMSLTQLSADLSSFKNISQDMSKNALKGIFTGETEALKNLGVVMTQEVLEGYAKTIGMRKKFKDLTQTEKIELRYKYVMTATKNAQGDFLRTGGNYANQKRVFEEQQRQLETNLGKIVLPKQNKIMLGLNQALTKHAPKIEKSFGSMFKSLEEGLKICSPIFERFNGLLLYLKDNLLPEINNYLPIMKTLLVSGIVPAVSLILDGVKVLFGVINTGYNVLKGLFGFLKDNWLPLLLTLPLAVVGVQFAIDTLRLKMALLRMEGGLMAIVMNTQLMTSLTAFTANVWKSVTALLAQAAAFAVSPVGLITLGIIALVGVVALLWKNWDKVTATLQNWWNTSVTLLGSFWAKCQEIFPAIGNFIKNNFTNILLGALGPVGLLIRGVMTLGSKVKALRGEGGGIEIKGGGGGNVQNRTFIKGSPSQSGKIDVGVKIENGTKHRASSSLNLEGKNGLTLNPA